jgi:outer membrane protein TolC
MKKFFILGLATTYSLYALSLDEAISKSLKNNIQLKKVILQTEQSKEAKKSKKSKKYGKFNLVASYDHYNIARTLAPLPPMEMSSSPTAVYSIPTTKDMFTTGVNYNVILFNGNALQNSYKISDILEQTSKMKENLAKEELIYNIKTLYITLLALQKQLKAQEEYTKSQHNLLKQVQYAYKLGRKSKLDILKVKNTYQSSAYFEAKILSNIDILKSSLTTLMGGYEFDKVEDINIDINEKVSTTKDIKLLNRYKLLELKSEVAKKKVNIQKASYYPVVDFSAYYGYNYGPNATTNTYKDGTTYLDKGDLNSENIWQAGVHLKWNIYDFGEKTALLQKEKISKIEAMLDIKDTQLQINKELKNGYSKLKLSMTSYYSANSELELLDEIAKVEKVKYENDAATITDLLDAKAKQKVAYAKMISAKYEFQKAKYYIDYLLEKGIK